ncbi:MAG TPA: ABC transporter permease [Candidatus Acidoferrales bacterium]|nr:ABC transporter permease [Candidatus Acidoferrales bacterium]
MNWVKRVFARGRVYGDLSAEIKEHLEEKIEELVAEGMPRKQAEAKARKEFGNVTLMEERGREVWQWPRLESFIADVRYGLRMLRKSPGFTAVAVLTLALGIGANTTILSVISGLMLRQPPVSNPDALMIVSSKNPANNFAADRNPVSVPDFLDWRQQSTAFSGMAAANFGGYGDFGNFTISGGAAPELVAGARVTSNFFNVLGVEPLLGRAFLPGEDQTGLENVVILSNGLWRSRFASDPGVIGRSVQLNGNPYTVIGVLPTSFRLWDFDAQIWIPLAFTHEDLAPTARANRSLQVFARLKSRESVQQASAEMAAIAQRLAQAHPESDKKWGATVMSLQQYSIADANAGPAMTFLMAAAGFVLLIACANLAGVLLARNSARRQEYSIRAVLGAGRLRLACQLLVECLILSVIGGGLGILFAYAGIRAILSEFNWNAAVIALGQQITNDWRVALFTAGICIITALIMGLAPALQVSRRDVGARLAENARSVTSGGERHRMQRLLVVGQISLSLILLTTAGFFVGDFLGEIRAKTGFDNRNLLTASVSLRGLAYLGAPQRESQFYQNVLQHILNSPGALGAAATSDLPFTFPGYVAFVVEGHPIAKPADQPSAGDVVVSPGYFGMLGIPLLQGREFISLDGPSSPPVVIVDQAFAKRYFSHENPIGRHVQIDPKDRKGALWSEIVGVVGNVNEYLGETKPRPHMFEPFLAHPTGTMSLVVRTRADSASFSDSLRQAVWAVDTNQAVSNLRTMDRVISDAGQGDDIMAELMGAFSLLALAVAAVGIYGVLSYLVAQRTHEIGIRMALGAKPGQVLRLVMQNGMVLIGAGVGLGFLISLALPRVLASSFNDFSTSTLGILGASPLVVILVGFVACWIPARRAMRVDPMVALRYE